MDAVTINKAPREVPLTTITDARNTIARAHTMLWVGVTVIPTLVLIVAVLYMNDKTIAAAFLIGTLVVAAVFIVVMIDRGLSNAVAMLKVKPVEVRLLP